MATTTHDSEWMLDEPDFAGPYHEAEAEFDEEIEIETTPAVSESMYSLGDEPEVVAAPRRLLEPDGDAAFAPSPLAGGNEALIPRITIEAFCERPEVLETLRLAARDRRLSKATVHLEEGGVRGAIERLTAQASPNLLILDLAGPPASILRELDALAALVDPSSRVVVIGAYNDIALYRELMRRGVSEYLVAPVQPLQIIQAISALYVDPERPFVGRLCAIAGARGGVGASTIAHNLAYAFAERFGVNTTLVDLDLSFGTVSLDFNQDGATGVADALAQPERIDETLLERLLLKQTDRLSLLTAPANLDADRDVDPGACEVVLDRVRKLSPFVVLDLPHVWSGWMRQTLLSASDVILVATPDLGALRNCKNMVDLLRASRPHDPPPTIVLNQIGVPRRPEVPVKDFAEALGIEPAAILNFEPIVFGAAANNGQMLFESAPQAKVTLALEALAGRLCGREPTQRKASLLAKVPFLNR